MSISNFSISQNPNVVFLRKLNSELESRQMIELAQIEKEPDQQLRRELRIKLMYCIEKERLEQLAGFAQKKPNISFKHDSLTQRSKTTAKSNYSNTILSQKKKKLMSLRSKEFPNRLKKNSLFMPNITQDNKRRISKKRNSHQAISQQTHFLNIKRDILDDGDGVEINDQIYNSMQNSAFRMRQRIPETNEDVDTSSLSEEGFSGGERLDGFMFDNADGCSVESKDLEPEEHVDKVNFKGGLRQTAVLTLVKQRNSLFGYKAKNKHLNLLSFFKEDESAKHERKIPFDDDEYNYSYFIGQNRLIKERVYHEDSNSYFIEESGKKNSISSFIELNNTRTVIREENSPLHAEGKNKLNFSISTQNGQRSYSTFLENANKKSMETISFQKIEQIESDSDSETELNNQLTLDFDDRDETHYKAFIDSGCYGSFINLDQNRFQDKLMLREGSFFLVNEKRGFYVSKVILPMENMKKKQFLNLHQSFNGIDFCPVNLDYSRLLEFYHHISNKTPDFSNEITTQEELNSFRIKLNEFFVGYIKINTLPLICLSMIEYVPDYKIFRTVKKSVLFEFACDSGDFFKEIGKDSFSFDFGHSFYTNMKNHKMQHLNSISGFNCPYNLNLSFKQQINGFCLSYLQHSGNDTAFTDPFSDNKERQLRFTSSEEDGVKEGLWMNIAKYDELREGFRNLNSPVHLPYNSHLLFHRNVFLINKMNMGTIDCSFD